MCGLVGIFDSVAQREPEHGLLSRMNETLFHRGPDGEGQFVAPGVGLAHRRLSIIDLEGGHQPMFNQEGSVGVIYNGEIYNFQELAKELTQLGHRFRTRSDTEVIVHAWEQWGADCVRRFRGMFAFALWDRNAETLFLARDRLGKKPLYYASLADGMVVFASELKALLPYPGLSREIDLLALEEYFAYGYVPDPRTIYKSVAKLAPAHTLLWRRGEPAKLEQYWDLRLSQDGPAELEEAATQLVERLRQSIELRLIADVPIGAFLSGGVDSSGIVALMAGLSDNPVNSFTISFGHKDFDESAYAQRVAERYRTNHRSCEVDPSSFDLVDRLSGIYDEPFADSSAIPTFRVAELARKHVKVVLSGDGGDELFAGYRRYLWHQREEHLRSLLPAGIRRRLFGPLGRFYPKLDWAPRSVRAKTTFQELAVGGVEGYFSSVSVLGDSIRQDIYSPWLKSELQDYNAIEVLRRHFKAADTDDPLLQAQFADIKTYLPGDILTKVDRASMANSLEVRVPFLDHEFVEWSARLAASFKLNSGKGKYVLKRAFAPYVPSELLDRPKQGFSVPLAAWFRGPLRAQVREAMAGATLLDSGYFDMGVLTRLVDQHLTGARDHSAVLWSLLMFQSFLQQGAGFASESKVA